MSSLEKKEAIQNTAFGTVAGLVMGGPVGAALAGGTGLLLSHLQEKEDEKKRKVYQELGKERDSARQKAFEDRKKAEEEYKKNATRIINEDIPYEYLSPRTWIKKVMEIKKPLKCGVYDRLLCEYITSPEYDDYENHTHGERVRISYDYSKNKSIGFRDEISPEKNPYVQVMIFKNGKDLCYYEKGIAPIIAGNGIVYGVDDFKKHLEIDMYNPSFEKYNFWKPKFTYQNKCTVVDGTYNQTIVKYMYTVNDGKDFVILWKDF